MVLKLYQILHPPSPYIFTTSTYLPSCCPISTSCHLATCSIHPSYLCHLECCVSMSRLHCHGRLDIRCRGTNHLALNLLSHRIIHNVFWSQISRRTVTFRNREKICTLLLSSATSYGYPARSGSLVASWPRSEMSTTWWRPNLKLSDFITADGQGPRDDLLP